MLAFSGLRDWGAWCCWFAGVHGVGVGHVFYGVDVYRGVLFWRLMMLVLYAFWWCIRCVGMV